LLRSRLRGERKTSDLALYFADFGPKLLDGTDPDVREVIERVRAALLVMAASPTFETNYVSSLERFLECFGAGSLDPVVIMRLPLNDDLQHFGGVGGIRRTGCSRARRHANSVLCAALS
jgi:hypothetical protein